jgi:hypothetical protein
MSSLCEVCPISRVVKPEAVFAIYGWPKDLTDQGILARFLQLNEQRSAQQQPPVLIGE